MACVHTAIWRLHWGLSFGMTDYLFEKKNHSAGSVPILGGRSRGKTTSCYLSLRQGALQFGVTIPLRYWALVTAVVTALGVRGDVWGRGDELHQ